MGLFDKRHPGAYKYSQILRNDPCVWCGGDAGTIEHITPRSKMRKVSHQEEGMGRDNWQNLASSCKRCNRSRGSMGMIRWILMRHGQDTQNSQNIQDNYYNQNYNNQEQNSNLERIGDREGDNVGRVNMADNSSIRGDQDTGLLP